MLATLGLLLQPLWWDKSPRHIVASSTLKNIHELAIFVYIHDSILFSIPMFQFHIAVQRLETPLLVHYLQWSGRGAGQNWHVGDLDHFPIKPKVTKYLSRLHSWTFSGKLSTLIYLAPGPQDLTLPLWVYRLYRLKAHSFVHSFVHKTIPWKRLLSHTRNMCKSDF